MPRGRKRKAVSPDAKLTKGQLRKLNALRKSLGDDIAERAFAEWMEAEGGNGAGSNDKTARMIEEALTPLIDKGLRIPRGGMIVRRGRGRIIVERAAES